MPTQDDFVKTALRLPRDLHAKIQAAAISAGRSMNAEMIGRLQASIDEQAYALLMARLRASEDALLETTRKQRDQLLRVVERFGAVMDGADAALAACVMTPEVAETRRNIEILRAVIATVSAYR